MNDTNFGLLSLSHKERYLRLFAAAQERASDYSFINIWAWHCERQYEVAFEDELCWLRLTKSEPFELWAPVGDWQRDWLNTLQKHFPIGAIFHRVPKILAEILREQLGERVEISEQRSQWEYLYSARELVELRGNKFHKKKNLLNQFLKFSPHYEQITPELIPQILEFQGEWCELKQCDEVSGLIAEMGAIERALSAWGEFPNILGGLLRIEGKIVAYTIGEILDNTLIVHFEKGLDAYKGVYQGMNQIFLKNSLGFEIVNREQDMGFEGLRAAKMTYNPTGFIEKYKVKWTG